jgi:glycosyltransferase involved in cell wall biosynthesis
VVSFVGAIVYRKGVDILVEAWKRVQQECRESRLLLIGPSEFGEDDTNSTELTSFVDRIRAIIRNESLDVRMVGRTDQVPAFLQASDIFVLPSRKEGFGNVILEAMSCGVVPVVADMDGVSRETVVPGKTGYVFETRDQLVEILVRLIRNKDERGAFGGRAREDVLRRFTLEKIAEQYRAVYEEM